MSDLAAKFRELWDNLRDSYWRAEHQYVLLVALTIALALVEIPAEFLKGRAYRAGVR